MSINIEDKELNWSELLTQIMFKYLDEKITLDRLNTSDKKSSFVDSREYKEICNILDQLDSLNNAKATTDRYDAILKNLICLIIYDLEIECPKNLNNRVMEKLMSLDDLCPNYSRFQFTSDPKHNFDGKQVVLEYQKYIQPLTLEQTFTTTKLLDKITLKASYKENDSLDLDLDLDLDYTIKKHYIMEEYKKFKLKFFK